MAPNLHTLAGNTTAITLRPLLTGESDDLTSIDVKSQLWKRDEDGRTPLHTAASNGKVDVVQLFLEVTTSEEKDMKEWLEMKDAVGWTALICASSAGASEVVTELLAAGANPNAQTQRGQTSLHYAASKGNVAVGRKLLAKGADPNVRDNANQIPMHRAASSGSTPFVQLLIAHKSRLNLADREGNTPLHLAIESGHGETAVALIEGGADRERSNAEGKRPEEIEGIGGMEGKKVLDYIRSKVGPLDD